jgi:hypothetical protein
MSSLTIREMIEQVPQGQVQAFEPSILEPGEERYFRVWQNWDYHPERLKWLNSLPLEEAPWLGSRHKARIPVSALPPPDVRFEGPSDQVVDFFSTGSDVFFISEKLFRLIEEMDPGSLEHTKFELRAEDGALPFHAVMPSRVLEVVDTSRTTVRIEDEDLAGQYLRSVRFPKGVVFDNAALEGVSSFSDLDAHGWYWSKDLIAEAKSRGIRGIAAASPASVVLNVVEEL